MSVLSGWIACLQAVSPHHELNSLPKCWLPSALYILRTAFSMPVIVSEVTPALDEAVFGRSSTDRSLVVGA